MNCQFCHKDTDTKDPYLTQTTKVKNEINVVRHYLKGKCDICKKLKSRFLGIKKPTETADEILKNIQKKIKNSQKNSRLDYSSNQGSAIDPNILATVIKDDNLIDGEGIIDAVEDGAKKLTKFGVRQIPLIGDLLIDSGLVDSGINWFSNNIWQPIKKFF